jgi:hypothetical protein
MPQDELYAALLELYPEDLVEDFLERVDKANESAMTRIARSTNAPVEEVVEQDEEVEVVEDVEDEEDEDTTIELDENFVTDLVGSEEFVEGMRTVLTGLLAEFRQEIDERFRALTEREADVPARAKRTVVSYRPRTQADAGDIKPRSLSEIAEENVADIFGG